MKMKKRHLVVCAAAAMIGSACAPPPFVLVDQKFFGENKTAKVIMQQSGEGVFDEFIRVCDVTPTGEESNCKDTLVLENVVPWSLY